MTASGLQTLLFVQPQGSALPVRNGAAPMLIQVVAGPKGWEARLASLPT